MVAAVGSNREMAQIRLQPPNRFNFREPEEWPRWKRRFEQFRVASGLKTEDPEKQVSTLLYCLGEEAEAVLESTNINDDERKVYDTVLKKFDDFFRIRKNVIYERACFNCRNQLQGETAEQYIMALYALADNCDYGTMKEELIRDRLVVGIVNDELSRKLQLMSALTLEMAKKEIRQHEAVHEQQQALKNAGGPGTSADGNLEAAAVFRPKHPAANQRPSQHSGAKQTQHVQNSNRGRPSPKGRTCTRCGRGQHPKERCPARSAVCFRCERTGHYSKCCYSKTVAAITTELDTTSFMDTSFLDTMSGGQEKAWFTNIKLKGTDIAFKLDTGAEMTAITSDAYLLLGKPQLNAADRLLCGPSRHPLSVLGKFECDLAIKGKVTKQDIFVVKELKHNLLGLPAITALKLAVRVDCTQSMDATPSTTTVFKERFPQVFEGLGNLGEEYDIKLKPDAKPDALYTPRHVPLPLRPKVIEELNRMEAMGIISRVDEPTPWCAGMVVVPKKSGAICICVDLKPLNESVLIHPLPKVDDTIIGIAGILHLWALQKFNLPVTSLIQLSRIQASYGVNYVTASISVITDSVLAFMGAINQSRIGLITELHHSYFFNIADDIYSKTKADPYISVKLYVPIGSRFLISRIIDDIADANVRIVLLSAGCMTQAHCNACASWGTLISDLTSKGQVVPTSSDSRLVKPLF